MDEVNKAESHLTSASAFVEGGIQDACDDSCSICLESFSESDPSSVTTCKHEFHLQCILEWCQRSSNCPMCWQPISLKDPSSQELLDGVEQERHLRLNPARNATIFHHPTLGDFELQHLPAGVNNADLEDRIIQHLAAAAAMGRARHIARREVSRSRSSVQSRPHFVVFSRHSNASAAGPASASVAPVVPEHHQPAVITPASLSLPRRAISRGSPEHSLPFSPGSSSQSIIMSANPHEVYIGNSSDGHSPVSQDRGGPSDYPPISESWKSRLNAISVKYTEKISRSTRGWKERLFSRNNSISEIGSEVRREVDAGIASVSRMMERLETRGNDSAGSLTTSNDTVESSVPARQGNHRYNTEIHHEAPAEETPPALAAAATTTSISR